jgi:hypothetical protein
MGFHQLPLSTYSRIPEMESSAYRWLRGVQR